MFPTVQLSVAGFAVSLEPLLLSFLHELPTDAMAAAAAPPAAVQPSQTASALGRQDSLRRPPTAAAAAATPPHSEDGREEEEEGGRDSNNHDLLATLKLYAAKVCVSNYRPNDLYLTAASFARNIQQTRPLPINTHINALHKYAYKRIPCISTKWHDRQTMRFRSKKNPGFNSRLVNKSYFSFNSVFLQYYFKCNNQQ